MTRSAEWDSDRGRRFDEKGPARTLNRWAWFHVQAMKDDKPRLSACTSHFSDFHLNQGAILCSCDFAGRSSHIIMVGFWRRFARTLRACISAASVLICTES